MMQIIDPDGIYGYFTHYGLVVLLVGSAFILFTYFWYKERLDMDEEPKFNILDDNQDY